MKKYSTIRAPRGPLAERANQERDAWNQRVQELAAQLTTPLTPREYRRHPITGELCEVR